MVHFEAGALSKNVQRSALVICRVAIGSVDTKGRRICRMSACAGFWVFYIPSSGQAIAETNILGQP